MKGRDLILITAHCPDIKRKNLLHDLVISLQEIRVEYDIMISSHTHLSSEITESVEYTYYDSSNKILKDITTDYVHQLVMVHHIYQVIIQFQQWIMFVL